MDVEWGQREPSDPPGRAACRSQAMSQQFAGVQRVFVEMATGAWWDAHVVQVFVFDG